MSQVASLTEGFPYVPKFESWQAEQKLRFTLKATGEELAAPPYINGEIFRCAEHEEDVMVDTVRVKDGKRIIKLVSLDKMYEGNPMEYEVSEPMLAKYYTPTSRRHPFIEGVQYAVSAGE